MADHLTYGFGSGSGSGDGSGYGDGLDPDVLEWASIDSNEACKPSKSRG